VRAVFVDQGEVPVEDMDAEMAGISADATGRQLTLVLFYLTFLL
jgi:hypothetical protein